MAQDSVISLVKERRAEALPGENGLATYQWNLTRPDRSDPVVLYYQPQQVLPIVFVPGIMGSNLRSIERVASPGNPKAKADGMRRAGTPVWRLDATFGQPVLLAMDKWRQEPGARQKALHPDRTEVDPEGAVPSRSAGSVLNEAGYRARGWGEVGEASYHEFLLFLEESLNGKAEGHERRRAAPDLIRQLLAAREKSGADGAAWLPLRALDAPTEEELKGLSRWRMPVYACGYNWLDDNAKAAQRLLKRIQQVVERNNVGQSHCRQVLLISHSMGGLVTRACAQLPGAEQLIAGIVHGVMPADGAAVAYRRCKVGMWDEEWKASLVIGRTGQHTTAVFAQAPGALQLLPTQNYHKGWLEVRGPNGKPVAPPLPAVNPYEEIYRRRDRWWGLIREEWLAPEDGVPITWEHYLKFLQRAETFHARLGPGDYHGNTHAFYGDDREGKTRSFERLVWRLEPARLRPPGEASPTPEQVYGMSAQMVNLEGSNPERVGRRSTPVRDYAGRVIGEIETGHWALVAERQDGSGDGTVPASSGRAPLGCDKVKQVFKLRGVEHEPAYKGEVVQRLVLYSLCKLAAKAVLPSTKAP